MVADEGFDVIEARTVDEAFLFLKKHNSLQLLLLTARETGACDPR